MIKRLCSLVLVLALLSTSAFASELTTSGSSGESQATVEQDATTFSVTLPSVLPVWVDRDGVVTVATNAGIRNEGFGPVSVTAVTVTGINDWSLVDFDSGLATARVGDKKFGFELNDVAYPATGLFDVSCFSVISGNDNIGFTYDAVVAPQASAVTESIANVVFSVGWYAGGADISGYEIALVSDLPVYEGDPVLMNGQSADLSAIALYSTETAVWSSSDEDVITVNDTGVMTAVAPGIADITYTMGGMSDTLTVRVARAFEVTHENREKVGYTGTENEELVIPAFFEEDDVLYCVTALKTVDEYDPDYDEYYSTGTFEWCDNLTSVTIPDSVTSIGDWAFYKCGALTSVTILDSVTTIGKGAFCSCASLTDVTIPNGVTSIEEGTFSNCGALTSVIIPESVTSIGSYAFEDCKSLTSVIIPESVTSIGSYAFEDCESLTSVTIPDSVTSIGECVFCECESLTSISVDVANSAYCSVDGVLFSKDMTVLVRYPSGKTATSYVIPESVISVDADAFCFCNSLTSVTIPDGVTSIGKHAFYKCGTLTSVTIPDSVTSIGGYAFFYCDSLTSVTIPDNMTCIGERAFNWCDSLTSVTIPDSVTCIGEGAFGGCSALTAISVDAANAAYCSVDGVLFSKDMKTIVTYPAGKTATSYVIPDGVTSIGAWAFWRCFTLAAVTIPDSVTSIGECAFTDCDSLTDVTIPDSVTSIGEDAFCYCWMLSDIQFSGTQAQWQAISKGNNWNASTGSYTIHCSDGDIAKS